MSAKAPKQYRCTDQDPPFGRVGKRSWHFSATQKSLVYDAIDAAGSAGTGRKEISQKTQVPLDRVSFYLSDLRRAGLISVIGEPIPMENMNAREAQLHAMLALENALVSSASEYGLTDEMNRAFIRYTKVKELVLRPGTTAEGKVALRMALVELVKAVF